MYVIYALVALFVVLPWIPWGDRPMILLDLERRAFYFPGFVIWPQEFYYLFLLLFTSGILLFFITAMFGRIWCGWTCPQTVYVELFDAIGRLLLPSKFGKRSAQLHHKIFIHAVWIIVILFLTFHFVAYFLPTWVMLQDMATNGFSVLYKSMWPKVLLFTGAIFYFNVALFREQFCVYLCPYARFQSVMLDRQSIVIAYDSHRGEPRRGVQVETTPLKTDSEGDCTNCGMCVQVCPTGIDIRNGLQVSCINCGHCVDACSKEMGKFDKPSLVNYSSLGWFEERIKAIYFRTRTIVYMTLLAAAVGTFSFLLYNRVPIQLWVIPDPLLQAARTGDVVQNYYKLDVGNITEKSASYTLEIVPLDPESPIKNLKMESDLSLLDNVEQIGHAKYDHFLVSGHIEGEVKKGFKRTVYPIQFIVKSKDNPHHVVTKKANFIIPQN